MNCDLEAVRSIVRDLKFVNEDLVPIQDASVVCYNTESLSLYTEYADNFGIGKDELLNAIEQELELSYSTFGASQTKVLILFYGSPSKADECADYIKDSLQLYSKSPFNSQSFQVNESSVLNSIESAETRTREQQNEDPENAITSSQAEADDCSSSVKDLGPGKETIDNILQDLQYVKKSHLEQVESFKNMKKEMKQIKEQVEIMYDLIKKLAEDDSTIGIGAAAGTSTEQEPAATTSGSNQGFVPLKFEKFTTAKAAEDFFENKIIQLRESVPWIKSIRTLRIEEIPLEKMRKIRSIIVSGPQKYGRFLNRILTRLFGITKMKNTLMVKHSARHMLRPGKDRSKVFSTKEEKMLTGLLLKIDQDLFKDKQVWEEIVRKKANQFGRDLSKRNIEEDEEDPDLASNDEETDEN